MTPIKIAIVEDSKNLLEGLQLLINNADGFTCVGAWLDAKDILLRVQCTQPTVILMDIDIPGNIDGIEATRLIKAAFPDILIVMQTVFDEDDKIFQSIKAGASGYLLKGTPPQKLLEFLKELITGGAPMSPKVAHRTLEMFRNIMHEPYQNTPSVAKLSDRQKTILEGIINGKSYKTLADEMFISLDTVRFHVKNVYELLQVHSKYELIMKFRK
jgi:DNA-binding NarL/FixJ family response regulator